jgi:hypothetical protein
MGGSVTRRAENGKLIDTRRDSFSESQRFLMVHVGRTRKVIPELALKIESADLAGVTSLLEHPPSIRRRAFDVRLTTKASSFAFGSEFEVRRVGL